MGGICPCFKKRNESDEADERTRLVNPNTSINGPSRSTSSLGQRTISERITRTEPTPVNRVPPPHAESASVPYNTTNSIPQPPPVEERDPFQRIIHNAEQAIIDMASFGTNENNQQEFERRLRIYQERLRAPEMTQRIQQCLSQLKATDYPNWKAPRPAAALDSVSAERARTVARWSVDANASAAAEVRTPSGQRLVEPFNVFA